MKIPTFRFGWLEYYLKRNIFFRIYHFCFGTPFLHSQAIAFLLFHNLSFKKKDFILDIGSGDGNFANWISYQGKELLRYLPVKDVKDLISCIEKLL